MCFKAPGEISISAAKLQINELTDRPWTKGRGLVMGQGRLMAGLGDFGGPSQPSWLCSGPSRASCLPSALYSVKFDEMHRKFGTGQASPQQQFPNLCRIAWCSPVEHPRVAGGCRYPHAVTSPSPLLQNEEGAEEAQESEDDFEEMNLSLLSARNFPRKASQTSIFLQEWDIPFEQLEIGELIGKGRFGQVFHGRWHGEVAIRLIDIERDNEDQLKAFKREVMAYRQTRHENVVLFMGACMSPPHLAIITR